MLLHFTTQPDSGLLRIPPGADEAMLGHRSSDNFRNDLMFCLYEKKSQGHCRVKFGPSVDIFLMLVS